MSLWPGATDDPYTPTADASGRLHAARHRYPTAMHTHRIAISRSSNPIRFHLPGGGTPARGTMRSDADGLLANVADNGWNALANVVRQFAAGSARPRQCPGSGREDRVIAAAILRGLGPVDPARPHRRADPTLAAPAWRTMITRSVERKTLRR